MTLSTVPQRYAPEGRARLVPERGRFFTAEEADANGGEWAERRALSVSCADTPHAAKTTR